MKKKIFIFVITYRAQYRVLDVLKKFPYNYLKKFTYNILVSDDCSDDNTKNFILKAKTKFKKIKINFNKKNLGYGAHIKNCLKIAIKNKYDYAIMIHGDNQYDPKYIKSLLDSAIQNQSIMAVVGSRMKNKNGALNGKMPLYKFIGNILLTKLFNFLMNTNFSDAHSGLWLYNIQAFKVINLLKITDSFNFDNQIRLMMVINKMKIKEVTIKTYYGSENSYFHLKYAIMFILEVFFFFLKKIRIV